MLKFPGFFSDLRGCIFSAPFIGFYFSAFLLNTGVSQGSILGLLGFFIYPFFRSGLIHFHGLKYYLQVDNSEIYIFSPVPKNLRFIYPIANLTSLFGWLTGISNITWLKQNSRYSPKTCSLPSHYHLGEWSHHLSTSSAKILSYL